MTKTIPDKTLVRYGIRIGRINRAERKHGLDGYVIEACTEMLGPGESNLYGNWVPASNVTVLTADNVCEFPRYEHFCGRIHLTPNLLAKVRAVAS